MNNPSRYCHKMWLSKFGNNKNKKLWWIKFYAKKTIHVANVVKTNTALLKTNIMAQETFTLAEVRQLLIKKIPRYSQSLHGGDNSGFSMGERNMAKIVDEFLEHHGMVSYYSGGMISVEHVSRKDLTK